MSKHHQNKGSAAESDTHALAHSALMAGDHKAAKKIYISIVEKNPDDLTAYVALGSIFEQAGNIHKAVDSYRHAVELDPTGQRNLHNLGRLLIQIDKPTKAAKYLKRALDSDSSVSDVWCDYGIAQKNTGNLASALECLDHAVDLNPRSSVAQHNLGLCLRENGQYQKAADAFITALEIDPGATYARTALASMLSEAGQDRQALEILNTYLGDHADDVACHQTRALIQLKAGNYKEGFNNFDWRLKPGPKKVEPRPFKQKTWSGQRLTDERLLIWLEQGVGDEILSLSMLEDISKAAPNCLVECDPRLVTLLTRSFPHVEFVGRSEPADDTLHATDYACPIWSTARYFRHERSKFPNHDGYIQADPDQTKAFRHRYQRLAKTDLMIGLSWTSSGVGGRLKTPLLRDWKPLLRTEGVSYISLQYDPVEKDVTYMSQRSNRPIIVDSEVNAVTNLDSAAAQIAALDGVITISNSTAHLAGALGVPTATLIPNGHGGFWYWHRDTSECPWYPSMTLCRQISPLDWRSAVSKAQDWLVDALAGKRHLP